MRAPGSGHADFNSFITAERNGLDVLICTVEEIRTVAEFKGLWCTVVPLDSQFRCGGSDAYLRWVVRLLVLEGGGPVTWEPDCKVGLVVMDSPQEMEDFLLARRAEGYGARISAGCCWMWTTKVSPGQPLPADFVIGDWARPWNVYGERSIMGAPPSALWATNPAGFGQVGCVYTAQGFEYGWRGVIIGPDLVWRGNRWVETARARHPNGIHTGSGPAVSTAVAVPPASERHLRGQRGFRLLDRPERRPQISRLRVRQPRTTSPHR